MKTISLFVDQNTYLTKMHPFAKAAYTAGAVCIPLITGRLWMFCVWAAASFLLLASGRVIRKAVPLLVFSFTIIITVFLIHGLFHKENQIVLFEAGPLTFYKEGFLYASRIGLNILNMLLAFAVFVLTTKPSLFVDALEQAGFSPKLGYVISSVFQIIPQMMGTMNTIMDAQKSRGLETEGNLLVRAKAFIPLISPVVTSSLINTRERAIALEVRGFDSKVPKTFLEDDMMTGFDKSIIITIGMMTAAAIGWRILNGIY